MFNLFHNLLIHYVCREMQIEEIRGNSQGEVQAHHFHMVIYYSLHEFFTRCTWILVLKYYLFMGAYTYLVFCMTWIVIGLGFVVGFHCFTFVFHQLWWILSTLFSKQLHYLSTYYTSSIVFKNYIPFCFILILRILAIDLLVFHRYVGTISNSRNVRYHKWIWCGW